MDFETALKELTIENLVRIAIDIPDLSNDLVFQSYQYLIDFSTDCIEKNNKQLLTGLAHMVYGWMPTMLEYKKITNDNLFFEAVRSGSLEIDFLNDVKNSINNSIVGGSKFLHFLNPTDYAIFDSRVFYSITKSKSYDYNTNNCENYLHYTNKLRSLRDQAAELKQCLIQKKLASEKTSLMRCMEMCLFYKNNQES